MNPMDPKILNAYLGVSFCKTAYFSRSMMQRYIQWVCTCYQDLLIIVADHLEVYNKQVFDRLSYDDAEAATYRTGLQYKKGYQRSVPKELSERVQIRLASEILTDPGCAQLLGMVQSKMSTDQGFARSVRETVKAVQTGRLSEYGMLGGRRESEALDTLQNYLIEEVAIILYINCCADRQYHVSIFPYDPPQILLDTYSGRHSNLFASVTGERPYMALKLVAEGRV
ncbi:MAG TPA: tRNA-dependent cyclodipeptide synthase [Armatimonadetes bacterium]|nr:tRNA-dependent cyclodipeptide synthase [Armatimonadota bacterium]